MKEIAIKAENISKQYRLGKVGTGTLSHDLNRFWHKMRGKEDPYLKIGQANDRSVKGASDYVWSLQDINFEIEKGDAVGIIGRNGAGKSTLLKLLSKVTRPTTGSFKITGRIASLLEVGTGFNPEMTGRENVFLNGAILGMRRHEIKRKFDEIVDFSGVAGYIDTPVKRYSSGMYVRLAFAVAAYLESEILIVDEVLAVGDAEFQKKCLGKMGDVSKGEGRTVLFVSHNMAAVKTLCTNGIVLDNGQVVYEGTSEDAADYYLANNFNRAGIELADRIDRKGDGRLRIQEIKIFNSAGTEVSDVILGEPYRIVFDYACTGAITASDFTVVIQILDQNERLVTTFGTDELGVKFLVLPKTGKIEIEIPRLHLRAGVYFLSFMFSEKKSFTSPHTVIDYLANAKRINVISSDLFNSGVILRPSGYVEDFSFRIS
jgi:lipopolysaccharide transport system ATP-binding protein